MHSPLVIALVVGAYFLLLYIISRITAKNNDNDTFFIANRNSAWPLVAFGMIGTSISGITFISIPGTVGAIAFNYFQVVLGYMVGYLVIVFILLPLYYRLNLTSIYTYLDLRYGGWAYRTGSFYFLLARTLGSAVRMFLAATVFQIFLFDALGFPFEATVLVSMLLILLYSIRGGIKTIIWTDSLQTFFLVLSLILTIIFLCDAMNFSFTEAIAQARAAGYTEIFNTDPAHKQFFPKQFLIGMFITIGMTGLDQDLMQKNLTCRTLRDSQKNMLVFSVILALVNLLFLFLGALLYIYAKSEGIAIPEATDELFPTVAFNYFPPIYAFVFLIGITAATFASTDSALTALTTAVCVDFLGMDKRKLKSRDATAPVVVEKEILDKEVISTDMANTKSVPERGRIVSTISDVHRRYIVHIVMSLVVVIVVVLLYYFSEGARTIDLLFKLAGYTYGPLLGLYAFGLFSRARVYDKLIPFLCLVAPLVTFGVEELLKYYFDFILGNGNIIVNGLLMFLLLAISSAFTPQRPATARI